MACFFVIRKNKKIGILSVSMFLRHETKSLIDYLKRNWEQSFLSLVLGLLIFWVLILGQPAIDIWIPLLKNLFPPLSFILILSWLFFLAIFTKTVSFWSYYRNSYFVKGTRFALADIVLLIALPSLYWLYFQSFLGSNYFQYIFISLMLFVFSTYLVATALLIRNYLEQKKLKEDKLLSKTVLFSDEPIDDLQDDAIGRGNFAQALKENIYNLSFKESFVMALYGRWGEGKTSILNLLKKEIRKENKLLIYEFDPWFYGDENALTTNFYHGLEDLLQESYFIPRKLKEIFKFYPEVLIKGLTSVGISFHNKIDEDRPMELKKQIEEFVGGLNKRILVIIDDIDRLQKDDILAVFKLIKLTSHIKNLVFLISFDVSRVIKILKAEGDIEEPESYIEKIVQLPINIPTTDQGKIDKFLLFSFPLIGHKSEIDKLFDRIELDTVKRQEFDKEFVKIYQSDLRQVFSTYRAAKRYLNSILFRLPFIEREVFLYDFFIVEIIQTFYPKLYTDMKSFPWYYFSSNWSWESIALSPLPYDKNEKLQAIKNHIEILIEKLPKKEVVVSLLESIFPEVHNAFSRSGSYHSDSDTARINKRVTHPECYSKYFMLGTKEGVISDAEFEDMLKQWKESSNLETTIEESLFEKYQKEFKLVQLFERLKLHSQSLEKELILPLIKTLSKNSKKLQGDGELWMTEFDQADGLIFRLIEDRNILIPNEEIQPLLKELIRETPNLHLASLIVLTCTERENGGTLVRVRGNVNISELKNTLEQRLTEHFISETKDIFEEYPHEREFAFILYQWVTNWGEESTSIKTKVNDYLIKLFKQKPTKLAFFLKHHIKELHFPDERKYFDYRGFNVAYEVAKFAQCLTELGERAYSTESEKEIIDLFLNKYGEVTATAIASQEES